MGRPRKQKNDVVFTFSIREQNEDIIEFLKKQRALGFSMEVILGLYLEEYGDNGDLLESIDFREAIGGGTAGKVKKDKPQAKTTKRSAKSTASAPREQAAQSAEPVQREAKTETSTRKTSVEPTPVKAVTEMKPQDEIKAPISQEAVHEEEKQKNNQPSSNDWLMDELNAR